MRFVSFFLVFSLVALFAACGGNVVVDTGAGAGGAQGTASSSAGSTASSTGALCVDAGPGDLPSIYKGCSTDADCTTQDVIECCTNYVLGVANDEIAAYTAYEKACVPSGGCPCPIDVGTTITEDGKSGPLQNPASVSVGCKAGLCESFTP